MIQLIVGLGNPGNEYTSTRHNAGAWLVEKLADDARVTLKPLQKFHGLHGIIRQQHVCHLLIPTTFMNNSGGSVQACAKYYQLPPASILIAHDDIDLPVGTIRLKFDGGDGGHNGLKDIIRHLHTKQFYRLRIGVGRPKASHDVIDYVLTPPSRAERESIEDSMISVVNDHILSLLLAGDIQKAMQMLHTDNKNGE